VSGRLVVTISREYGAAGNPIARGVAETLGYELLADDVPAAVADSLGTSAEAVERHAEEAPTLVERVVRGLAAATPELLVAHTPLPGEFDGRVRAEIEGRIGRRAASGDVVILGRCGSAVLGPQPGVVRVFLVAGLAYRTARVATSLGYSLADAGVEVDRVDVARRRFARERYGFTWGDPHAYDLVVDAERAGIAGAIAVVVAAVRARAAGADPV